MVNKYLIFSLVVTGSLLMILGLLEGDVYWIIFGSIMTLFTFLVYKREKEKFIIDYYKKRHKETEDESKVEVKFHLKYVLALIIAIMFLIILYTLYIRFFASSSFLSSQTAISDGCRQLDPNTLCRKDPSKIIISADVNGDGIIGGSGDTLYEILKKDGCIGDCIKARCGCPQ